MYDVCAHSILPKSAILVLGLLKKKDKQFCVGGDTQQKKYLALHKRISAVLKVHINADTTVENAYTVKS